jgi:hypothetical protein
LNASFSLLEKITDDSFAIRMKRMHDVAKKYADSNDWKDFDDSIEDFEVRNFCLPIRALRTACPRKG